MGIIKDVVKGVTSIFKPAPAPAPVVQQPATPKEEEIVVEAPETTPAVQEARRKERELARRRRGRSSTLLTGPAGLTEESDKKTLLGQ